MLADYSKLKNLPSSIMMSTEDDEPKDSRFVKWMTAEKKLATIPVSAFYSKEHKHLAENYIRFCFSKVSQERYVLPCIAEALLGDARIL